MEPRVKQRLVGAAILVGLVVILVPEMLSGPHETEVGLMGNTDAQGPLQTYTIDLTAPGSQPREPDPAPAQPLNLDPAAADGKQDKKPPEPTPEPAPPPKTDTRPSPPPDPAPAAAPSKQVDTSPPASSSKPAAGDWAVQVGSFAKVENARRAEAGLAAKGYPAFTAITVRGSSKLHMVRVGPQKNRVEADKVNAQLKRDGFKDARVVSNK